MVNRVLSVSFFIFLGVAVFSGIAGESGFSSRYLYAVDYFSRIATTLLSIAIAIRLFYHAK
jgi:hypothetical protein